MLNFDCHVHTEYCGHAEGMSVRNISEKVCELGLDNILITEHIFKPEDVKLFETIKEQVSKLQMEDKIIVGFEVDVDPFKTDGTFTACNELISQAELIMGAVHYVPGIGNYPHCPEENPLTPEKLLTDWRTTLLGMLENRVVDILAHPARLAAASIDLEIFFDDVLAVLKEAAEISAENGVAWEINNLTCARLSESVFARWHETIQTGIDAGVKITYGSDAHSPEEINKQGYVNQMLGKFKNFEGFFSPAEILRSKHAAKK